VSEIGDITYKKGDYYPFTITIADKESGLPINTTGKTFTLMVNALKAPENHDDDIFQIVGVNDGVAASGKVTFSPTAQNHSVSGKYFYEIKMQDVGGVRTIVDDFKYTIRT
jgi:hypothetical protein